MRTRGKLLWFNETKDVGALETDDGERLEFSGDAFVPGARPEGRCAGTPVEMDVVRTGGAVRVSRLSVVTSVEPRRARVRSHGFR